MIEALDAFGRARKNISGLTWAAMMGGVDKKYRPIMHKSEGVGQLHQRLLGPLVKSDVEKREAVSPELSLPRKELIGRLSFSHFVELLQDEFD